MDLPHRLRELLIEEVGTDQVALWEAIHGLVQLCLDERVISMERSDEVCAFLAKLGGEQRAKLDLLASGEISPLYTGN